MPSPSLTEVPVLEVSAGWHTGAPWAELREAVTRHGAVVVRGLEPRERGDAVKLCQSLPVPLMAEREPFAPRDRHAEGVYSSSKWPPDQPMCMHHELSYALEFPALMIFACVTAPGTGGATAIADSASVLAALPRDLVERFERDGWLLERTYNGDVGVSVAEAFGTSDRGAVEAYCRANAIDFEWRGDGVLRTRQLRPAVVRHPVTGARCWFNQIAFLNEWTMAPEIRTYLVDVYGADSLPFTTRFGDGTPVPEEAVTAINGVYDEHTVSHRWRAGDVMITDNIQTSHSTQPYTGNREIVVAMAEPVRLADRADPLAAPSI
ncbi:TauD/TfdA family dioxygenase [Amycolatopsis cynarae]|uniref:TauD/TfdA family dioxygenase n=1 Tax=Amycolatopsis cynarae TaxID=2995223 RepID=A0ABY7ATD4_9PSEU|nr:TauD/TfdA family dioxygenase [Amycolatopsis sp. HUAS 11-8]WAL62954.1 TauD/TfdA family dioxygenase [Amycolatopsis sp. HUAS 11-8]